ncbi:MAG: hypothetical protein WD907_07050 [Bacilli bacterium]
MAKSEFFMYICFIRKQDNSTLDSFHELIHDMLTDIFAGKVYWYLDSKTNDDLDIVVAELKGMVAWKTEEEVLDFLEKNSHPEFWEFVNGYHIQVYPNQSGSTCTSCEK